MSFELTDAEALEVRTTIAMKHKKIVWTLENVSKIKGKEKLEERKDLMQELIERLDNKYKLPEEE